MYRLSLNVWIIIKCMDYHQMYRLSLKVYCIKNFNYALKNISQVSYLGTSSEKNHGTSCLIENLSNCCNTCKLFLCFIFTTNLLTSAFNRMGP